MEILYKAKRKHTGEWVEGHYYTDQIAKGGFPCVDISIIRDELHEDYEVFPETVCRYIGREDKNGKKVFDGDTYSYANVTVNWCEKESMYELIDKYGNHLHIHNVEDLEFSGNIHDKK